MAGKSVTCTDSGFGFRCRDTVLGAPGATCKAPKNGQTDVLGCGAGEYCDDPGTTTCRTVGKAGDPCSTSHGDSCVPGLLCSSGTCVAGAIPVGGACTMVTGICAPGSHCDSASGTCVPSATFGGPCLADGTCAPLGGKEVCVAGKCGIAKGFPGSLDVCTP